MSKGKKADSIKGIELMAMYVFLMLFLVVADQITKRVIDFTMEYQSTITVIDNFFSLFYVRNTGSAFSLLADKPWGITALSVISAVMGIMVIILMGIACKKQLKLLGFAFCLIASGAFGNLIDRLYWKYVIDFLRFDFGDYTFPIFNFADICAVVGTIILMSIIIFGSKYFDTFWGSSDKKKEKKEKKEKKTAKAEAAAAKNEVKTEDEQKDEAAEQEAVAYLDDGHEELNERPAVRTVSLQFDPDSLTEQDDED